MTKKKRFMLMVEDETAESLDWLKKEHFYNKTYATMYRYILDRGIEAIKKEGV